MSSVRTIIPFTHDIDGVIRDLPGKLPAPSGETPLPQAIISAYLKMKVHLDSQRGFPKGKIILLADGQSSCFMVRPPAPQVSKYILKVGNPMKSLTLLDGNRQELEAALTTEVQIMSVGFDVPAGSPAERDLQYAAAKTRGRYVNVADGGQLARAFDRFARSFSPRFPNLDPNGKPEGLEDYKTGSVALKTKNYTQAVEAFTTYAKHNPEDRNAYFNIALAQEANEQFRAAAASYRRFASGASNETDRNLANRLVERMDENYRDQCGYHAKLVQSDVAYLENYFQQLYRGDTSSLANEWLSFIEEKGDFYSNLVARTEIDEPWSRAAEAKLKIIFEDLIRRTKENRFDRDAIAKLPQAILLLRSISAKLNSFQPS